MASRASGQDLLVGLELGHYRIVEKIGAGGMGEVYRARDEHLARDVAIKVLPPGTLIDESARKHFHKEALILSQLNHPNVATIHDFDTQQGVDFLVMEYIPGTTLSEKVAAGPLPEKEVLRLGVQLAEGLSAAHEHGVVHRDLKPGNLRLSSDGRLKILDFGLATLRRPVTETAATESFSETQTMAGTLPYMAPEQLLGGEIDARTDIHAAGSVLYEMATGQRPFANVERSQLIGAILRRPPRSPTALNPRLSPELVRIAGKCLEKEPENRYQSAKELAIDLRRMGELSSFLISAPSPSRFPWRLASTGFVIMLALAAAVVLGRSWVQKRRSDISPPQIRSLAVLPLENFSHDPAQEYFADEMTEALITDLAKLNALRVISRTSIMQYKGMKKSLPQISKELGVDAVVEGSVQRSGNRVRITVQLIQASNDTHLWADSYERDLGDVLALQDEVAQDIADKIRLKLTPQEKMQLASARAVNPAAYEAYLQGRFFTREGTIEGFQKSLESFQKAVEIDPGFALGYAELARSYLRLGNTSNMPSKRAYEKGTVAALKALRMDDTLSETHVLLAEIKHLYEWDQSGAEREYKRAIDLNPSLANAHGSYSLYLDHMARCEEAMAEAKTAKQLDPLAIGRNVLLGIAFYCDRDYDQAIVQFQKELELDPTYFLAQHWLVYPYLSKGMYEEAIAEITQEARHKDLPETVVRSQLGVAYGLAGKREEAVKILDELRKKRNQEYVRPRAIASLYAALAEKKEAIEWLEKSYEERDDWIVWTRMNPEFESLRSDARFQDLMRRIGLPP
jgi:serine/threonine protein kinase